MWRKIRGERMGAFLKTTKRNEPFLHGKIKNRLSSAVILLLGCLGLSCGAKYADRSSREIPVDFPFDLESGAVKDYTLTLTTPKMANANYELKLCDREGEVLQKISCGPLKEPVTFSYDGLKYGYDTGLELFPADSQTGLFYAWDDEDFFSEEGVEIPKYDEVRNPWFVQTVEDGSLFIKTIYQINETKKRTDRLRSWSIDRAAGTLQVWDYLENRMIFEGNAAFDGEGNLRNSDYYEFLFWHDIPLIWNYSKDSAIRTWSTQRVADEDVGATAEYESRQALLAAYGFWEKEPLYQYFDRYGNLKLEFYFDEDTKKGCGITYQYRFTSDLEKIFGMKGFAIDGVAEKEPQYTSKGSIDWLKDAGDYVKENIRNVDFIYREDGSLFCRKYWHNGYVFGTTYADMYSYYDETGRLVYESAYITHGRLEYYYIYEKDKELPSYLLYLDDNMGYAIPGMVRYTG